MAVLRKILLTKSISQDGEAMAKESGVQYEFKPNKIVCAIDIAWHRGDPRIYNFAVSVSSDSSNFVKIFSSKSSGKTNSYERYAILNSIFRPNI